VGRPAARSSRADRNAVIEHLNQYGPGLGVWPLRHAFPHLVRAELTDLHHRYRRVWRRRHRQPLHVLQWASPGTVWAIDFAEAPNVVDGIGQNLLAVRDLASGQQLLWQPVDAADAQAVVEMLTVLFERHGPPLVLKTDNGSPFASSLIAELLADFEVLQLFSPPRTPRYNGAIEAGIGSMKMRTQAHAARHGRTTWTCDDLAAATLESNAYAKPRGPNGPTPDESWTARASITHEHRVSFRHTVEDHRCAVRRDLQLLINGDETITEQRQVDRAAIRQALVGLGYLQFQRRSIPQPIRTRKAERVS
jgi:transposase InsO family protein